MLWLLLACARVADTDLPVDTDPPIDTDTGGDTDTDAPIDTDTGEDTDTGVDTDTDPPEDPFVPATYAVSGQFTVLADGTIGTATNRGTEWPPLVRVELFDARHAASDDGWACTVEMIATAPPEAAEWAWSWDGGADVLHHGFVLPDGAEITSDCPASVDPTAVVAWPWGLGVGTMRADLAQALVDLGEDPTEWYGGGAWIGDPADPAYAAVDLGFGFQIDPDGELARDDDGYAVRIDPATVGDGPLPPGFYQVLPGFALDAAALFP